MPQSRGGVRPSPSREPSPAGSRAIRTRRSRWNTRDSRGSGRIHHLRRCLRLAAVLSVTASISLIVAGLVTSFNRSTGWTGDLALMAGLVWVSPMLVGWEGGPPLHPEPWHALRGIHLRPCLSPGDDLAQRGRVRSRVDRVMVSAVYLESGVAAIGLALFRDPFFDPKCWANCTVNTLLIRSSPPAARAIAATDRWFTVAAASALVVVCLWRIATDSRPARRSLAPVALPGVMFAGRDGSTCDRTPTQVHRGSPRSVVLHDLHPGCTALILLAAGMLWAVFRVRADRKAVARIVTNLGVASPPGSLESALSRALSDKELRIAYWLAETQRYVDAKGKPVPEPTATTGRMITTLVRGDQRIAVVSHEAACSEMNRELGAAVRLALENERLQARGYSLRSRSLDSPEHASSRRGTQSGVVSSGTFTTARNSAC